MAANEVKDRVKHGIPQKGEKADPVRAVDAHGDAYRFDAPLEGDKKPEMPLTEAAGAFSLDREGTVEDHEANVERTRAHPTFPIRMKQGYFPKAGNPKYPEGKKIPAGTELELPIEEARYLIESDLAERADDLPDTKAGKERKISESKPEQDELYAEFLTWKARTARDRRN